MTTLRIIGVDPGSRFTGWGVVDACGNELTYVDSGRVSAPADRPLSERLCTIYDGLDAVLSRVAPQEAALESVFTSRNAQSALKLGHARGVAMLALARRGLVVSEYTAGEIKQAVVGAGRAEKHQVQQMVRILLGLAAPETEDASDALAAAICRCQRRTLPAALQGVRVGRARRGWR